jgi:hypothetical protein
MEHPAGAARAPMARAVAPLKREARAECPRYESRKLCASVSCGDPTVAAHNRPDLSALYRKREARAESPRYGVRKLCVSAPLR